GAGIGADGTLIVSETSFEGNVAERGGGIYFCGTSATIDRSSFSENYANGAAISTCGDIAISESTFTQNLSRAIEHYGGDMTIDQTEISHNDDGGLAIVNAANSQISNSTITYNSATAGAGIYHEGSGTLDIDNSTIAHNTASGTSGGIFWAGFNSIGTLTITDTLIAENSAYIGGGMQNAGSNVNVLRAKFVNNSATSGFGSAVYVADTLNNTGVSHFNDSCFTGNALESITNTVGVSLDFTNNWWGASNGPGGVGTGSGDSVSANVTFTPFLTTAPEGCTTLPGSNQPALANDDAVQTDEDIPVVISVLANDTDPDGNLDPSTVRIITSPINGIAVANADGTVTYTPNVNFFGSDSFTYTVSDGSLTSNVATVSITVHPINDAPVAVDDGGPAYTTDEDTPLTVVAPGILAND
ncbi:MAG: tandem-95 repeat protein, partial [Anaerolineae bacterium]|nr:tandem-95 repeat protein [Anaerolineae bacterium]